MKVETLISVLGADFYTGVPDSQLRPLCDFLMARYGTDGKHHIIAANEGNAVGLAAGYHLATGKTPVVYLQNSGEGNIINPVASLLNEKVYGIPCIFIVGWRGEPGVHDEPQHIFQGEVTLKLLEDMNIDAIVISAKTTEQQVKEAMENFCAVLNVGKQVAFVVRKGALSFDEKLKYENQNTLVRENAIRHIVEAAGEDIVVCTTGKASRELFEIREANGQDHGNDFLTVGSMGHSSSIAMGIALQKPEKRIWIVDGDGAVLMHMGAMAVLGANAPGNIVHVVINNAAHETVGGMPTVAGKLDLPGIAKACGYYQTFSVDNVDSLDNALQVAKYTSTLTLLEVKCALGARADLGRPTTTPQQNKSDFMRKLSADPS